MSITLTSPPPSASVARPAPGRPTVFDLALQLAESIRCRILLLLEQHELAVSELCAALRLPQSTVSRHLKVLVDGGWLSARRDGTSQLYRLQAQLDAAAAGLWRLFREQLKELAEAEHDARRVAEVLLSRRARSQEFFASSAQEWDRLRDELFGRRIDALALAGLCDPSWRVGDLGCGTGRLSATCAPFVREVVAVDGSRAMLDAAAHRLARCANVRLLDGELESLPLDDGELDVASLVLALHHASDPARVVAEAERVLRPGGRLLILDLLPHGNEEFRHQMGHLWLGFSRAQLEAWVHAAGLEAPTFHELPSDLDVPIPSLFIAVARKAGY
jgi:SAM-dependent methyltransferase